MKTLVAAIRLCLPFVVPDALYFQPCSLPSREKHFRVSYLSHIGVALRGDLGELVVPGACLRHVARRFGGVRGRVEAAETIRLFGNRRFVLLQGGGGWPNSISMSPSNSRAGKIGPGVTTCFSVESSCFAAARASWSARAWSPSALAIQDSIILICISA